MYLLNINLYISCVIKDLDHGMYFKENHWLISIWDKEIYVYDHMQSYENLV